MQRHTVTRPKLKTLLEPKRLALFLNVFKTFKLIKVLMVDRRIAAQRKVFFVSTVVALWVALLFPDLISEPILNTILPIVGAIIGIPLNVGLDWIALSLVSLQLLRFFPKEIVEEHYTLIFGKKHPGYEQPHSS